MGEEDAIEYEYLDRTAWHKKGRPDKLDAFFRTATLRLSPLPRLKGKKPLAGPAIDKRMAWSKDRIQGKDRSGIGIEAIFQTAFESRPTAPNKSRRPYAFGSQKTRANTFEAYRYYTRVCGSFRKIPRRPIRYNFSTGMYRPMISTAC